MTKVVSICGCLFLMASLPQNHQSLPPKGNDPGWEQIAAAKAAGVVASMENPTTRAEVAIS